MRGEYGKLMYLLQDAVGPAIQELLGFSCVRNIRTVYDVLEARDALEMLQDARLAAATMVVASDGKSRAQIQRQLKQKAQAIRALTTTFASRAISRETLEQCLSSIADNQYHLYFGRDPIDRMITLLTTHFDPENEDADWSLAIVSGSDGARLSHTRARQYHYREIVEVLFRFWYLTDEDLLADGTRYELTDTGKGLHRIQDAPRVSRAVHVIIHATQRTLDAWVGSSVIHLGDKNVPNALMFLDKYTQVGHILRPIVKNVDRIESLSASSTAIADYEENASPSENEDTRFDADDGDTPTKATRYYLRQRRPAATSNNSVTTRSRAKRSAVPVFEDTSRRYALRERSKTHRPDVDEPRNGSLGTSAVYTEYHKRQAARVLQRNRAAGTTRRLFLPDRTLAPSSRRRHRNYRPRDRTRRCHLPSSSSSSSASSSAFDLDDDSSDDGMRTSSPWRASKTASSRKTGHSRADITQIEVDGTITWGQRAWTRVAH
ncbi:hypothetical protein PsorP6_013529 [Peronosclerospora sorghi]|uniref:Uncharacterized protein n=1 Tax=Peronosclerospora sorghi TaxID=230839 RepID=A0ACC0VFX3_9STRA|nr:hypothetical protein PsorP6_013529 [Peronosclerospora sorghi]